MGLGQIRSVVYTAAVVASTLLFIAPSSVVATSSTTSGPANAASAANILGLSPYTSTGSASSDSLTINLGYGIYKGTHNATSKIRSWKGIAYAEPPVGSLRWQKPRQPKTNTTVVHNAVSYGSQCPQAPPAIAGIAFTAGSEDCLYVNVYSPDSTSGAANGVKKPVLVWIHGGGYGMGNGANDFTDFINDNNNEFVAVSIQYRLGAFGFLASADLKSHGGLLNAGLIDQAFALLWVQNYIGLFGGDPSQVTISGESSGGGSVMYHTLAEGGNTNLNLFHNAIAASPYLTPQFSYNAAVPTQRYNAFAAAAGCSASTSSTASSSSVWNCLVAADSLTLQYASSNVSDDLAVYATWAFVPVTDGSYIQQLPSQQLAAKKVVGANIMVGNNADEGALFVAGGISTDTDLANWVKMMYPSLSAANVTELLAAYSTAGTGPSGSSSSSSDYSYPVGGAQFETDGVHWPTANDVSMAATGPQQRAYNIYGEAAFACTAYFLAEAFTSASSTSSSSTSSAATTSSSSSSSTQKHAFQYQYSVPFAYHESDVSAYLGPPTANQSPDFVKAFRQIWGGLVVRNNPSILAAGGSGTPYTFPAWTASSHQIVSLNTTGGTPTSVAEIYGATGIEFVEPGLQNAFKTANADTWEGGRAARCEVLRSLGAFLPQ